MQHSSIEVMPHGKLVSVSTVFLQYSGNLGSAAAAVDTFVYMYLQPLVDNAGSIGNHSRFIVHVKRLVGAPRVVHRQEVSVPQMLSASHSKPYSPPCLTMRLDPGGQLATLCTHHNIVPCPQVFACTC